MKKGGTRTFFLLIVRVPPIGTIGEQKTPPSVNILVEEPAVAFFVFVL